MPTFVVRSTISPRFREGHFQSLKPGGKLPEDIAPIVAAHVQYGKDLKAKGNVICGGPVVAFTWGLTVLKADSLEQAKKLVENDPGHKEGLFTGYEIEPWYHIN